MNDDVVLRKTFLSPVEQRRIVEVVYTISPGFYVPKTRWG
jgi:hypothetical protein